MDFDYEVNGRILVLPIVGQGPGYIILREFQKKLVKTVLDLVVRR